MRKIIIFCIGLSLVALLCGCEGDNTEQPPTLCAPPREAADGTAEASPSALPEEGQREMPREETDLKAEDKQPDSPPAEETPPEATPEGDISAAEEARLLATAETELLDKSDARLHNLNLAAAQIHETVIEPGREFSFNQIVGPRTAEAGYQRAAVIVENEKKQDFGGGVCQISSTVYQAAKAAGLSIQERHSHRKDVGYASQGHDAAVNYDSLDMRFINNTDKAIQILVTVGKKTVVSKIYQLP